MNELLALIFFEDYFVCTILPNESAWEALVVNGVEEIPLYFYVSGGDIRNDDFAKERFEANDRDAFGDFYETILNKERTFKKYDLPLEPIHLLSDSLEQVRLSYEDRIKDFVPAYDNSKELPVNVCFIPGISREARGVIGDYLGTRGFRVNKVVDYFEAFLTILRRKGIIHEKTYLALVESYFGDLLFHYIEFSDDKVIKKQSETLIGKGVDYRVGNLAKLMVEKAAKRNASRILGDKVLFEQEVKKFHSKAAYEINKFEYNELEVKIELSDFSTARVTIDERELNSMSAESFKFIEFRLGAFINKHSHPARIHKIILNGDSLSTDAFVKFFEKTFGSSKVIKPVENFVEVLSRGVFAASPLDPTQGPQEVEIKITLTTRVPLPEIKKKPAIPPLPEPKKNGVSNGNIPLPPIPDGVNLIGKEGIAITDLNLQGFVELEGKKYSAVAATSEILKGQKVKVLGKVKELYKVERLQLPPQRPPLPAPKKKT